MTIPCFPNVRCFRMAQLPADVQGNHPVKAWRLCLDMDGTGICRWVAFNQACERIQWKGNMAKAWLGLDKQSLGFITLHNINAEVRFLETDGVILDDTSMDLI